MADRLLLGMTWLCVRLSSLMGRRGRQGCGGRTDRRQAARTRLRHLSTRRPGDLEVRLLLAELELAAGEVDRAIAEAGIAIQLAPDDLRGMSLLLRAQAESDLVGR